MKRLGWALTILGFALCAASFYFFGSSVMRAMAAREAKELPVEIGAPIDTGVVPIETELFCQVAVSALVRSSHAERGVGSDAEWKLEYAFPFHYTVYDEAGHVLAEETGEFGSGGGVRETERSNVSAEGGTESVEIGYEKFRVAPPGNVRVVARLEPDTEFGATIERGRLILYDRVSRHGRRIAAGVAVMFAGGLAVVGGVGLLIFAAVRG